MLEKIMEFITSNVVLEKEKFQNIYVLLTFLKKEGFYPRYEVFKSASTEPIVEAEDKTLLMFSSNNYLGLAKHPNVIRAIKEQAEEHGGGPGGSRFLCGNISILGLLDAQVAKTVGKDDAITFPTGYMANSAIFRALMDPFFAQSPYKEGSGIIFSDEYNHATVVDGCKLSSAKCINFKHNDIQDLENKLKQYSLDAHKLIVTEGVFSLDGHLGKLKEISQLAKKYNCIFMVDDAHGIGVLGNNGGGTGEFLGVTRDIDVLMGSFDKGIGCMGGYLAGEKKIIEYLRVAARPYMFSSAVPAIMAAGAIESLKISAGDEGRKLRTKLMNNSIYLKENLIEMGYKVLGDGSISVLPVVIGQENMAITFSNRLLEEGVFIPSFRWPAVPLGEARIRITLMATHTEKELNSLLLIFKKIGKELKII